MNKLSLGVSLAIGAALISGVSNFLNKIAVDAVQQPVVFTFLKNVAVAVILIAGLVISRRFAEIKKLSGPDWVKLIAIGVIGGSVPFILFFTGLTMTTAASASLIHKTLFVWVAFLAIPWLGERLNKIQWLALALLFGGNFLLGTWQQLSWGKGEIMVLAATVLWAIENIIAKKALVNLSSQLVAAARLGLGSIILLVVVAMQHNLPLILDLSFRQWSWVGLTSLLLFGYVSCWYASLKRAPVTLVASLLVPASLITSLLSLIFLNKTMAQIEILGAGLIVMAIIVLIYSSQRIKKQVSYVAEPGKP